MNDINQMQLGLSSILNVPLQTYDSDFTFIVNNEEFKTSRLVSDLLSPNICKIHLSDPTINQFTINTRGKGDFAHVLELVKFDKYNILPNELEFISEVIEILGIENIDMKEANEPNEITIDNVFTLLKKHEKSRFYSQNFHKEIEFVSSHFFEICETHDKDLKDLQQTTLIQIIESEKLLLKDEDQLLKFADQIYIQNTDLAVSIFERSIFANVSSETMREFIQLFDFNEMTAMLWSSLSKRLEKQFEINIEGEKNRYNIETNMKTFVHNENSELNGIIRYLTNKTGGNIYKNGTIEMKSDSGTFPNLVDLDTGGCYWSNGANTSAWILYDFKNMKVNFSSYSIKSDSRDPGNCHIKNWVFEVSDDGNKWTTIDEQSNYEGLNGCNFIKTFDVKPNNFSRFCRIRSTGEYYGYPNVCLVIKAIEFYGKLKEK